MRFVVFFVLLCAGCSPGGPRPAASRPLRDFRGIIHCHSKYSHDSRGTYEEILAAAKAAGIDFICMTDHPPRDDKGLPLREGWTGLHDGVLFIQGAEYSDQILALGLREPITGKDRRETIRSIHEQGGVAIACHPELIDDWDSFSEADGMEIYNVHATLQRKAREKSFLLRVVDVLKRDPEHSFRLLQELDPAVVKRWDEANSRRPFTGVAGNDAHQNVSYFGFQLDPYVRAFRFVTTHVLAEELTQEAILRAIRAGRCYVRFMEDPHQVVPPGSLEWIGREVPPGTTLDAPGPWSLDDPNIRRRWLRDGRDVPPDGIVDPPSSGGRFSPADPSHWTMNEPGTYRLEWDRGPDVPLLLTNPVRFGRGALDSPHPMK